MYNFVILTDNTVDMPVEWLNEHEVGYECLPCSMNGVVYDKIRLIQSCFTGR